MYQGAEDDYVRANSMGRRRRAAGAACGLLPLVITLAPTPATPQSKDPEAGTAAASKPPQQDAPGSFAPAKSIAWIHLSKLATLRTALADHPVRLALQALMKSGRRFPRSLASLESRFAEFARAHGLTPEVLAKILGNDTRLSLFVRDGKLDFLAVIHCGEHAPVVQNALENLTQLEQTLDAAGSLRSLQLPLTQETFAVATLHDSRLLVGGSREAALLGGELLRGEGETLSSRPEFQRLCPQSSGSPWCTMFASPAELRRRLVNDESPTPLWLVELLELPAVSFRSRLADGRFEEELRGLLPEAKSSWLRLLAPQTPEPELARLVPTAGAWLAFRAEAEKMLELLQTAGAHLPGVAPRELFATGVEGKAEGLIGLAPMLGSDGLLLGSPNDGLVLTLEDSTGARELLGKIAKKVEIVGGERPDMDRFTFERAGTAVHLAVCDDYLFIADQAEGLRTSLEQYLSGKADPMAKELFETAGEQSAIVGQHDPKPWLAAFESESVVWPIADHFDLLRLHGGRQDGSFSIRLSGITGTSHLMLLGAERVLPAWVERTRDGTESRALDVADKLLQAQLAFIEADGVDRDEDGIGECGSIARLIQAKHFVQPTGFALTGETILSGAGYRFTFLHPEDIQAAEKHFLLTAWPEKPGVSGNASFVLQAGGGIWRHEWLPDLDAESGPGLRQIFEDAAWSSPLRAAWKQTRSGTAEPVAKQAPEAANEKDDESAFLDVARAQVSLDRAKRRNNVAAIARFLDHRSPTIQARAAHYLATLRDEGSVPQLVLLLERSNQPIVRQNVVRALGAIGDDMSLATLVKALADRDGRVRLQAATGLLGKSVLGSKKALLGMIDNFAKDEHGDRSQAALALNDAGDASVLQRLVAVTPSPNERFGQALAFCFQNLSPKLEPQAETALLIKALASAVRPLRAYAIGRLGALGRIEALEALMARTSEEDAEMQPLLTKAINAVRPADEPDVHGTLRNIGRSLTGLYAKFGQLPPMMQYAIMLTPIGLLLAILGLWLARRRRRRQEGAQEFLQPSEEWQGGNAARHEYEAWDDDSMWLDEETESEVEEGTSAY